MVRLADLDETTRNSFRARVKDLSPFAPTAFVKGPPLARRRVAIVATAGLHRRGDVPFTEGPAQADYRVIPGDARPEDLVMSHASINFDRSGFQQDLDVVFPLQRLRELAARGAIGSVADIHYSFMGALAPKSLEPRARQLAGMLKQDQVDAVLLSPV
jgi:D-proline reductase (dithiol) PrdB